jgi:transposase-like protein
VLTETTGTVEIEVPRDRAGMFEPQTVRKRQRRLSGVDEVVLSLYVRGLTTREISARWRWHTRRKFDRYFREVAVRLVL